MPQIAILTLEAPKQALKVTKWGYVIPT